jgi:predicted nucleic acid-binding protein
MTFVDTGAWYAAYVPSDPDHAAASAWLAAAFGALVTTDYIIDELLTLMRARGQPRLAIRLGTLLISGELCDVERVRSEDFDQAWRVFSTYQDKAWSFTDCVSRVVMGRLGIAVAFAFDEHFRQFGSVSVVP